MMNYTTIMAAVDGSSQAEFAFQKAAHIAARNDAALYLVNIIDNRSFGSIEAYGKQFADDSRRKSEELMGRYEGEAKAIGVKDVHILIEFGAAKSMIPGELADRLGADLIICGATGTNAAERFVLGSVSERIVRNAKCDVLVVRPSEEMEA